MGDIKSVSIGGGTIFVVMCSVQVAFDPPRLMNSLFSKMPFMTTG